MAGVQFLLDGAPLGAEDTTAPYVINWNASTASAGAHTLSARARDAAGRLTTSATISVTVSSATPSITWAPPASIVYGTALSGTQLNATASVPGTFAYNPPAGTVLNAGAAQTLSVIFTPTDTTSYSTATANVTITVTKATPSLTWPTPASIVYGTVLSSTQLNAHGRRRRHVLVHAGGRNGAAGGRRADAVGDLHADRCGELHDGDRERRDHRHEGDAVDHLADTGRDRLRHDALARPS